MPVILAGGVGSRLWPLSREAYPKHLLTFLGDNSLLQDALLRVRAIPDVLPPIIVSNLKQHAVLEEQLQQLAVNDARLILEPMGRNTAAAAASAALDILEHHDDALMLVLPADLIIKDIKGFVRTIEQARVFAEQNKLLVFGIKPEYAETGYGYIKQGEMLSGAAYDVAEFVEKPSVVVAQQYCDAGQHYWNAGMFLLSAKQYLTELEALTPGVVEHCREAVNKAEREGDIISLESLSFSNALDISIDKAVMEKTQKVVMAVLSSDWRDAGSWKSLYDQEEKDVHDNVVLGQAVLEEAEGCYVRSDSGLVAVLGVKDLVIVEEKGALLVAHKDKVQDIKALVKRIKEKKLEMV